MKGRKVARYAMERFADLKKECRFGYGRTHTIYENL